MGKINILDNKTINKIAAGEVVERPASIVKELIENSIDAKASAITIEIKNGGISFIRITDNGTGIPKDEIRTAFTRHATSKIKDENDLDNIISLGFRGEALASIAAISQIEIITKEHVELTGIRMEIDGGTVNSEAEVGCPEGTTMIVRNIFYNTPARRKFLKTEQTEASYIDDIVRKIALSHPEIAFKFINNNKIVLSTSGNNDLQNVIFNIYGKEVAKNIIEINKQSQNILVEGFLGKPEINRATRIYENFFVNGRYIKSSLLEEVLENSYKEYMMQKRFPFCVLKLIVPTNEIDVNVHPAKTEIRFKDEEKVKEVIGEIVRTVLNDQIFVVDVKLDNEKEEHLNLSNTLVKEAFEVENRKILENCSAGPCVPLVGQPDGQTVRLAGSQEARRPGSHHFILSEVEGSHLVEGQTFRGAKLSSVNQNEQVKIEEGIQDKRIFVSYKIVGQLFNTYWVIEQDNNMYIIDQHAAHEKVLYEKLIKQFENGNIISQQLLQPIVVEVSLKEKEVIENNLDLLKEYGFELEEFGFNSYAIREVPIIFDKPSDKKFFLDIVDEMLAGNSNKIYNNKYEEVASIACKAAVKANDRMDKAESEKLINDLMNLENPFNCPHGRPIIIAMSKYEIEKKFKRIV